jgi:hypothetical protein
MDMKPVLLLGTNGPTSYSNVTRDPVANPGAGQYIEFPMQAITLSKSYEVTFYPLGTGLREGSASASQSGWVALWRVATSGAEVSNATNLSAESVVFGAFVSEL